MTGLTRRDALKMMGALPLAGALEWSTPGVERATRMVAMLRDDGPEGAPYVPRFFNAHEWRTVRVLSDIVIPRDERSGSATEAKAPEFIDFMLAEKDTGESSRVAMRGGLAWLDLEMRRRFNRDFLGATAAQRKAVLDDIAFPKKAKPEFAAGVAWFTRFRNALGSAFFSSQVGWEDLRYIGNVANPGWNGCPEPALRKLGVSYAEYDASLERRRRG